MKKLFLIIGFTYVYSCNAQGLYFGIQGGYNLSLASQSILIKSTGTFSDITYESIKGSYGKGINLGVTAGYMLNKNFGAEIGFEYLKGGTYKCTSSKLPTYTADYTATGKMMRIIPGIKLTTSNDKKIKPYLKAGMVIGVGGKITSTEAYTDVSNILTNRTWEYSGGISLGASAGLGINFSLGKQFSLFGELNMISQSWSPKKSVLTKYTIDGVDQLPMQTTAQKETNYSSSYVVSTTSPPNSSEPNKALSQYFPFSSWGINLGISFSLGKSE